jgi:hypothetical protein
MLFFLIVGGGIVAAIFSLFSGRRQKGDSLAERAKRVENNNKQLGDKQREQAEIIGRNDKNIGRLEDKIDGSIADSGRLEDGLKGITDALDADKSNIARARQILDGILNRSQEGNK